MKILAGDIKTMEQVVASVDCFLIGSLSRGERLLYSEIESIEVDSEETQSKGGVGSAIAGGLIFGGAGAVAGAVLGRRNKKESIIAVLFVDGRRMLASVDQKEYARVRAGIFDAGSTDIDVRREGMVNRNNARLKDIEERKKRRSRNWRILGVLLFAFIAYRMVVPA